VMESGNYSGKTKTPIDGQKKLQKTLTLRCFADRVLKQLSSVADEYRRCEETVRSLECVQRERERASAADHAKMQDLVAEMVDEMNKRISQREMKLREDCVDKLSHLGKVCHCDCFSCCGVCCCLTWERCVTVIASAGVVCVVVSPGKGVSL